MKSNYYEKLILMVEMLLESIVQSIPH